MSDQKSEIWHDFMRGIHNRSIESIPNDEWKSWNDAGCQFYQDKYRVIYDEYISALDAGLIDE